MNGIILLCAGRKDAERWIAMPHAVTAPVQAVWLSAHLDSVEDYRGWTIVRTDRWAHDERVVGALRRINARTPFVDPTGLLGTDSNRRDDTGRRHPVRGEPTHADRPIGRVRR